MSEIHIYAAHGFKGDPPIALTVRIDEVVPHIDDPEQARDQFTEQGKTLADALWNVLPGGTVDQLLAALLQRKASLYRVRMPKGDPS